MGQMLVWHASPSYNPYMTQQASLYDRLGGAPAVTKAAELFYRKVLQDPALAPFFDHVDMDGQIAKQAAFLTMALGGPNNYTGRDLRSAHARLAGVNDEHFDRVVTHLGETLRELGVSEADIGSVAAVAAGARDDVLNR
jgi:truncated hemoglobin YjbI